jgi:hypothetical protein
MKHCVQLALGPFLLTISKYFFALSLTRAPQIMGILEDADPAGEVYDPAGIDIMDDDDGVREVIG